MALAPQLVPLILGSGIDTKTDPKVVQPGKLLVCENSRFQKNGTNSKRFGYEQAGTSVLGSTDLITDGKRLAVFEDELLVITKNRLYSYVPSSESWSDRGALAAVSVTSKQIVRGTTSQSCPDVATVRGVTLYAWEDSLGGIRATVVDQSSGLPIQSEVQISATGERPRVSSTANALFVHYVEAGSLKSRRVDPLKPNVLTSPLTLSADVNLTNPNFDIARHGTNLVFCYETTGNVIKVGYIDQDGDIGDAISGFPSVVVTTKSGSSSVAIASRFEAGTDDAIYVLGHNATNGLFCRIYNVDLTLVGEHTIDASTTVVRNIGALIDGTTCRVWYEVTGSTNANALIKSAELNRSGVTSAAVVFIRSLGLVGKPFIGPDDHCYLLASHDSSLQSTVFTLKHESTSRALVVNAIAKDTAGGLTTKRSTLANVVAYSSDLFLAPVRVKTRLVSESGTLFGLVGVQSAELNFDSSKLFLSRQLGSNLHIAGGILMDYDGKSVVEHGFLLHPEGLSNSISAGGAIEAGIRQYVAVYEWTDAQGQLHQSAYSPELQVTNVANARNTITVPTLRVTEKKAASGRANVSVALYRTKASGTVFYRVSSLSAPSLNDPTVDSIAIVDTLADTAIGANQPLYTTGGVLENLQPGSATVVGQYRSRLVIAGLEDGNEVGYSKEYAPGEPVNFSDLKFRVDQGLGPVTALVEMDEKLILFKNTTSFVQVGEGPTATGAQDDFRAPQKIPADVGCPFPQSVVDTPLGIMFKSSKGFYLLSRSLECVYIGAEVEDFNSLSVSGAVLIEDANEVRFTHSDGSLLVYDYFTKQWSVDTGLEAVGCALWKGSFCILKSDGSVLIESRETYRDAGRDFGMRMKTPWIRSSALQGAQRIWRIMLLGELKSRHSLRVRLRYDYDPAVAEEFVFDSSDIIQTTYFGEGAYYGYEAFFGSSSDPVYQVELLPGTQSCQSIQIEIDDLNPESVDGAGFSLTGITLEVGVDGKLHRLNSSKRIAAKN